MPKIMIGADIVPTKSNISQFAAGDAKALVGTELYDLLESADYRIFNLEVPLTDEEAPIAKCGPNLIAPANSVTGLKCLGVDFLTLANNHILDQGTQGLTSTMKVLGDAEIAFAGVGNTLHEAAQPYIVDLDGAKVGIYCCAEHEFSIATETTAGANPFDPLESLDHVTNLKSQCDYVIVLYHGGKEHYRYPSPGLQKTCRKIAEKGADLVVCQHSHCIGCEEKWGDSTIVYGQGNFVFDDSDSEYWQTSLLIELDLPSREIHYIPLEKMGSTVRQAEANAEKILTEFYMRSQEVKNPDAVEKRYLQFAHTMESELLIHFCGINTRSFLFRGCNKLSNGKLRRYLINRKCKKDYRLRITNFMECEAWRELMLNTLRRSNW